MAAVSLQIRVFAKSVLLGASGQVEASGKPTEVDVHREVDAHATVAKFSPTPSVHAVAYFDPKIIHRIVMKLTFVFFHILSIWK